MATVLLYTVSYHGDMWKECEILHKTLLPDLRVWCESKQIHLIAHDIRWGGPALKENLAANRQLIQEAYYNGEMPIFINLTSDSLGLVPVWGDASDDVIADIHKVLHVSSDQLDLLYAAYREDNPNSIVIVRSDRFLDELGPEERRHFVKRHLLSPSERAICASCLKKFPEHRTFRYSYDKVQLQQGKKTIEVNFDKVIFQKVLSYIQQRIEHEHQAVSNSDHNNLHHDQETVMKELSMKVRGCESVIEQLEDYLQTGGKDVPLLVLGEAGTGKSSVLARIVNEITKKHQDRWLLFYHFVGTTPGSTELKLMLSRLLNKLNIAPVSSLPQDVDILAQMCCTALSGGTECHLVLVVDAINEFDGDRAAQIMSWVPRKLAPNIRCILSTTNETVQHRKLMSRESKPQELYLKPLHFDTRKKMVTERLSRYNRKLNQDQMNSLLAKKGSENPLWLSLAAEELCMTETCCVLDQRIKDMPDSLQSLLEMVLERLECWHGKPLVACLCLLEVSVSGLLESELRVLLGNVQREVRPSQLEEKEETESSEKDLSKGTGCLKALPTEKWLEIYKALRPYLRPYLINKQARLHFSHRAFGDAVRRRYFKVCQGSESPEESEDLSRHWHHLLADYFEHCTDINRKAEEYLYYLCQIQDTYRLRQALCDWDIIDKLYNSEYSLQLLNYWRKAGGCDHMIHCYREALTELESVQPRDDELIAARYELIARIYLQAGKYAESLELAKTLIKWEEKELGNRPERMVELNSLMAEIYEENLKLNDFVSPSQLPELRKTIMYARKSIDIRKYLTGDGHRLKLALSLMKLAFSLESWSACGGNVMEMTGEEAILEGNKHIDQALSIFKELKDAGHYAEALMTKGVLATRGSMEQLKYYNEAMEICHQVYGEDSLLSSRLYINIGIVYEDNNDFVKAYEFFRKWAETSELVLGPDHPKTIRAKGVLQEPRYLLVALRLKQQHEANHQRSETDRPDLDEARINQEVGDLDDDEEENYMTGWEDHQDNIGEEEDIEQRENLNEGRNMQELLTSINSLSGVINRISHVLHSSGPRGNSDDGGRSNSLDQDHIQDQPEIILQPRGSTIINRDAPTSPLVITESVLETEDSNIILDEIESRTRDNDTLGDNRFNVDPLETVIAHFMQNNLITPNSQTESDGNITATGNDDDNIRSNDSNLVSGHQNSNNITMVIVNSDGDVATHSGNRVLGDLNQDNREV